MYVTRQAAKERMEPTMPEFEPDTQVQTFRRLYLAQTPDSHARMNGPQADKKYTKVHQPISDHALAAHLAGHTTLAAPLVGPSELTQHAALDIDHGGVEALHSVLATAQAQGWIAYAITSTTDAHHGGHVGPNPTILR